MSGIYQLIVKLMYGCGLRMKEVQNIRIKDIDFGFKKSIFGIVSHLKIERYHFL